MKKQPSVFMHEEHKEQKDILSNYSRTYS